METSLLLSFFFSVIFFLFCSEKKNFSFFSFLITSNFSHLHSIFLLFFLRSAKVIHLNQQHPVVFAEKQFSHLMLVGFAVARARGWKTSETIAQNHSILEWVWRIKWKRRRKICFCSSDFIFSRVFIFTLHWDEGNKKIETIKFLFFI